MRSRKAEAVHCAVWGHSRDPRAWGAGREVAGTCAVHGRPDAGSAHVVVPENSGPPPGAAAELCPRTSVGARVVEVGVA